MDAKAIQDIIALVHQTNLTEVEIEDRDFRLTIKRQYGQTEAPVQYAVAPQPLAVAPVIEARPVYVAPEAPQVIAAAPKAEPKAAEPAAPAANLHTITSPMIGTYYRTPGPDKDPFVKEGDVIKVGQPLCIVEAMKLFNEIESEVSGKIVKILVNNATPVEYDQPLFLVELS